MKAVIVGCGRVGAELADMFEAAGYDVVILDQSTRAFDRLPDAFRGSAVRGDGTDEDTLRRAGAEDADVFIAMTEGDNRNVMAAQLASEVLGARKVIAKINDPLRAKAYATLGIATLCRTTLMRDSVAGYVQLPESGDPGIYPPSGQHPGGGHDAGRPLETVPRSPIDLGAAPGEIATAGGAADDADEAEPTATGRPAAEATDASVASDTSPAADEPVEAQPTGSTEQQTGARRAEEV